jgi:hypothetical protein
MIWWWIETAGNIWGKGYMMGVHPTRFVIFYFLFFLKKEKRKEKEK